MDTSNRASLEVSVTVGKDNALTFTFVEPPWKGSWFLDLNLDSLGSCDFGGNSHIVTLVDLLACDPGIARWFRLMSKGLVVAFDDGIDPELAAHHIGQVIARVFRSPVDLTFVPRARTPQIV